VPATTLWNQHRELINTVVEKGSNRLSDIEAVQGTLQELTTLQSLRHLDTISKIDAEADMLIHLIKKRQASLIQDVQARSKRHQREVEELQAKAASMGEVLKEGLDMVDDGDCPFTRVDSHSPPHSGGAGNVSVHIRLAKLYEMDDYLKKPVYFDVPPQVLFEVRSRAIDADECISITTQELPTPIPGSLAVCMVADAEIACPLDVENRGPFGVAPGIIHFLGTSGRKQPYRNPFEEGLVNIHADLVCGSLRQLVRDPTSSAEVLHKPCRTKSERSGRIVLDFGSAKRVCVQAYSLQHGHSERHNALVSWSILGSNSLEPGVDDGGSGARSAGWTVLDRRYNNDTLGHRPFGAAVFQTCGSGDENLSDLEDDLGVTPQRGFFRYVVLEITGPNAAGGDAYHIEVAHMELYGKVIAV
jgi:hypothetical protein